MNPNNQPRKASNAAPATTSASKQSSFDSTNPNGQSATSAQGQGTSHAPSPFSSTTKLNSASPNTTAAAATQSTPGPAPPIGSADEEEEKLKPISTWDVLKSWRWEFLAAFLAVGVLVCEIVLLVHYNNKFLFAHWSHNWKINSVFAFLTTVLEASVMFYVAASMGQLRWHWYRKKQHRLDWLEIMTDASRPSGAMRLLFRRGMHRQFAALGALIVIFLLGVNTFTQQIITQEIKPFQLGFPNSYVPVNTNYTWSDTDTTLSVGTQQPLPDMVAAIQSGFYSFSTNGEKSLSVSAWSYCGGDTCDLGKYQSIGVCSACDDISQDVVNPCPNGNCTDTDYYTFSNGIDLSLLTNSGILNLTADTNYTTSSAFNNVVGPLIVRFNALIANETGTKRTGQGASALQCAAWWCVKTYNGTMTNGTLHEEIIDIYTDTSKSAQTHYGQDYDITLTPPQCLINNTTPSNTSYCTFIASAYSQIALQNFLAAPNISLPFPAFLSGSSTINGSGADATFNYTSLLAGGLISDSTAAGNVLSELRQGFTKMAYQMTVDIRGALASDYTSEYSYGTASYREQKFHVRWGWIAYPAAIVLFSLIFFLATIIMTRKDEAWKASVLPIMFHSFGGKEREEFVRLDSVVEMKKASRGQKVFLGDEGGAKSVFMAGEKVPVSGRVDEARDGVGQGIGKMGEMAAEIYGNIS